MSAPTQSAVTPLTPEVRAANAMAMARSQHQAKEYQGTAWDYLPVCIAIVVRAAEVAKVAELSAEVERLKGAEDRLRWQVAALKHALNRADVMGEALQAYKGCIQECPARRCFGAYMSARATAKAVLPSPSPEKGGT